MINFQAPDEGTGTDAILVAAGIEAVSEGDFSSSSNATSLVFKTGASAAAGEQVRITSAGDVGIGTDSPDVPLHVKGGSSVESAIIVDSTGVGGGHKYGIRPGSPSVSNAHFTIHDEVNDATRFVITDGGLVLINTTGAVAGQQLRVSGGSGTGTIGILAAANFNSTIAFGDPDSNTAGQIVYAHNGDQLRFHVAGASTAVSYTHLTLTTTPYV